MKDGKSGRWRRFFALGTKPLIAIICLGSMLFPPLLFAKTDVVTITNGDRLTGELKSLERGKLRFKTAATDTISIEWDDVASLKSDQNILVETEMGERYLGHLGAAADERLIVVETDSGPIELEMIHIVIMEPIEKKGFDRFDGDITAGYNFAKASEVTQIVFGFDLQARTETRIFGLDISSLTSDSQDNESSQRHTVDLSYKRLWQNRHEHGPCPSNSG